MNDIVSVPRELDGAVPRDVQLSRSGIVMVVVAGVLAVSALVGAIVTSAVYVQSQKQRALREREARFAMARVINITLSSGKQRGRVITWMYEVDGHAYTSRQRLRQGDRRPLRVGDTVTVAFLPSEPGTSWVPGYENSDVPFFIIPTLSISLLCPSLGIGWAVRRQWILLSEGRSALARVTGNKKISRDKRRTYRVELEFRSLSGALQTSKYETQKAPPPIGTVVPIVYHRDDPQWTATYPFALVTPIRNSRGMA